jgi:hypothetical protein
MAALDLAERLSPLRTHDRLTVLPTPWQIFQAELEMWPFVISIDVTDEPKYSGAPLGHPVVRQPFIFREVGFDHLRIGTGLRSQLISLCRHLQLTYHRGMPAWDLQLIQTHPNGLDTLRESMQELLADESRDARRINRLARRLMPHPERYHQLYLGPDGWIARAQANAYPSAEESGALLPPEYYSLVGFLEHAQSRFPATRSDLPWVRWPWHLARLPFRILREGGSLGWWRISVRD